MMQEIGKIYQKDDSFSVLDLGCGTGKFLSDIHKAYSHSSLVGIDMSEDMLKYAKKHSPKATFHKTDLEKNSWPVRGDSFDIVMSLFALHHLETPERFLERLKSVCTRHTHIFMADFALDTIPMKLAEIYWRIFAPSHQRSFSSEKLKELLKNHGFLIEETTIFRPDRFWCLQVHHLRLG